MQRPCAIRLELHKHLEEIKLQWSSYPLFLKGYVNRGTKPNTDGALWADKANLRKMTATWLREFYSTTRVFPYDDENPAGKPWH